MEEGISKIDIAIFILAVISWVCAFFAIAWLNSIHKVDRHLPPYIGKLRANSRHRLRHAQDRAKERK